VYLSVCFFCVYLDCFRLCMKHWRVSVSCLVNFWRSGLYVKEIVWYYFPMSSSIFFSLSTNFAAEIFCGFIAFILPNGIQNQIRFTYFTIMCLFQAFLRREYLYLLHSLGLHFLLCLPQYIIVNVLQSLTFFG